MEEKKKSEKSVLLIVIFAILLFIIAFFTAEKSVADLTDTKDYTDTAKFFAGEYAAKHRSAHSDLYGLLLSSYVKIVSSFSLIKLSSAFFLLLLVLSVYYISGKNKKTLLLMITLPIVWFFSPWVSPIPIASLLLVWSYYFIKKLNISEKDSEKDSENKNKIKYLIFSGLLIGLSSAFWDSMLYLSLFFLIAFFYDKKLISAGIFLVSLAIGFAPRLILDQLVYKFALYSILKHALAVFSFTMFGGIYGNEFNSNYFVSIIIFATFIPVYSILLAKKQNFFSNKKEMIFIILTILFIAGNPQPRMLLIILPLVTILLGEVINDRQIKVQLLISIIISLLLITPYIIQFNHDINYKRTDVIITNIGNIKITPQEYKTLQSDLNKISNDYPNQIFLVGNKNDDYRKLAHYYWGDKIKEFVSIEDYNLFQENKTIIASDRIGSDLSQNLRRDLWIEIGLSRNENDKTDYNGIKYTIGLGEPVSLPEFKLIKQYDTLYVSERISN